MLARWVSTVRLLTYSPAAQIAAGLYVSKRTVETHLASIYAKLGVESKTELVRRAGEFGI